MISKQPAIIGKNTVIDFIGYADSIPAKVDTGADSSSVWVSDLYIDDNNNLRFKLFDKTSPAYTGEEIVRTDFAVAKIRSSSGHVQVRYRTHFSVKLAGRRMRVLFNLSDRSKNIFPALIGRRTLHGKFHVDVSQGVQDNIAKSKNTTKRLQEELMKDPHAFYKKYHQ